jgi:hypothetical protein
MESLLELSNRTWYGKSDGYNYSYTITFSFGTAGGLRAHGEELETE